MSGSDNFAYQGAQDAGTAVHEYNVRDFHIQQPLAELRTAHTVQVVRGAYDANGNDIPAGSAVAIGYVDVHPMVNQLDGYGNATPHGTVYRIPYYRYQGAHGAVISDPVTDDIGEIIVHDRDTSVVRATNAQGNPGSRRKHDFADGVYHGQQQAGAPSQYLTFTPDGVKIADKNGNSIVMNSSGIVITDKFGHTLTLDSMGIHADATVTATGDVVAGEGTSNTIPLLTHRHPDPQGGNTGLPIP